jgi:hypothetical protein
MDNRLERYLDFSSDMRDVEAFRAGAYTHPKLAQFATEAQKYIEVTNPICAIRGLIALHAVGARSFHIRNIKSGATTNLLLGVMSALLAYIAYQLT